MGRIDQIVEGLAGIHRKHLNKTLANVRRRTRGLQASIAQTSMTDNDVRRLLEEELQEAFGSEEIYVWVEDVISQDGLVVFRTINRSNDNSDLFIVSYEMSGESHSLSFGEPREAVRRTTYDFDDGAQRSVPASPTPIFRDLARHHMEQEDEDEEED